MSTHSDVLGGSAPPVVFQHAGRSYSVRPVTQEVKVAVERWLRRMAYADLYALKDDMPGDQYHDALTALQADRASYVYMGPVYWKTIGTEAGSLMMVELLFQTDEADARRLIDERGDEVQALVTEQILASMPRRAAELARARLAQGGVKADPTKPA